MQTKRIKFIALVLAIVFSISLFAIPAIANEPPALNKTQLSMLLGGSLDKLEVLNAPEGAAITWASSDLRVARVSPNGFVISVSEGSATITANVGGTILTCPVTVYTEDLLITNDVFVLDTDGNPIFNQMGSIYQYKEDDPYYYWYGMNFASSRTYHTSLQAGQGTTGSTSWAQATIRGYKSLDLVTWEPIGGPWADAATGANAADVVRPNTFGWTTANGVSTMNWIARMGVLYNAATDKYVMVGQSQESSHGTNRLFYAVADSPEGPFNFIKSERAMVVGPDLPMRTDGTPVPFTGDMTPYFDRATGKGYVVYCINQVTDGPPWSQANSWETYPERDQVYVAELDPADFLSVVANYEVYDAKKDDYYKLLREGGREANCMFEYDGWYYHAASGLRGWNTSPSFYMGGGRNPQGTLGRPEDSPHKSTYTNEVSLANNMTPMRGSSTNFSHTTQIVGFATTDGPITDQAPIGRMILQFGDRHANNGGFGIGPTQFAPLTFLDPKTAPEKTAADLPKTPHPRTYDGGPDTPGIAVNPWADIDTFFPWLPKGYPHTDAAGNPEWKRPEWPIPVFNNLSQFYYDIANNEWAPGPNNNFIENPYFENDRLAGGLSMSFRGQTITKPVIQTYVNEPNGWFADHIAGDIAQINYGGNRSTAAGNLAYQLIAPGTTNQTRYSAWAGNYAWYHGYTKRNFSPDQVPYITKTFQVSEVPDGFYDFYGWVRSSGGQKEAYIYAGDNKVDINYSINAWTVLAIQGFEVKGGQVEFGFYSDAAADQWAYFDDFALVASSFSKADLEELVAEAASLSWADYTTASWAALDAAYKTALAVLADANARQTSINYAYYDLFKALEGLAPTVWTGVENAKFVSIVETAKNSRVWVLTFDVSYVYCNGLRVVNRFSINLNGNNANLDGKFVFPAGHALAGYTLTYDIKGNGSNIKACVIR